MRRGDTGGRARGALVAAALGLLADLAVPLLPIYGNGHAFVWTGQPTRAVAAYLVNSWASAVAVLVGIVLLRRYRSGIAGGVFIAVAIVVVAPVVADFIQGVDLRRWQAVVDVALQAFEAAALVVAASIAIRRWS